MRGRFITLEGGEGAGKSTQIALLAEALKHRGRNVITTREPGGTPGAEAIRSLLLDGDGWGARAEALLFAAARSDHVEQLIRPALARGSWVLCDRFLDSSRAYQGGAGELGDDTILQLHRIGSDGFLPDRTILLTLDPAEAARRANARDGGDADAIGGRGEAYHASVNATFRTLAAGEPDRFVEIDASGTPEEVHARIIASLPDILEDEPSC